MCCIGMASGQISYEKRLEFELNDDFEGEKVYEFGKRGFMIVSRHEQVVKKMREWKFQFFDTDLELEHETSIPVNGRMQLDESINTRSRLHIMFKDKSGHYTILSVEANSLKHIQVEGSLPKKAIVRDMAIFGDYAYFNATVKGSPYLFSVNWKTGVQKLILVSILNYKSKFITLQEFQFLEESQEMLLFARIRAERGRNEIYVVKLNGDGEKESTIHLTKNIEHNIISLSASYIGGGDYIFTGTYSKGSTSMSEGIFICKARGEDVEFIKFYNFLDLSNFLDYMSERAQEKIERKKERKESKGKEYSIDYRIATHYVTNLDDGFLFLGEAYYPTYRTETYTTTSTINGVTRTTTHTRQVFDGYRYTHAILAKFGLDGELVWDQIFEMWPAYKPFVVKLFIEVAEVNEDGLKLVFLSRNKINYKAFDYEGKVLQDSKSEELETDFSGDKVKGLALTNIDHWYENYFIAYGSQKIVNKEGEAEKRKRKVFFVSKIRYQ